MIDSKDLPDVDGFTLRAVLLTDTDSTPMEFECYTAADIEAWRKDDWQYVGLVVTVSRCGVELASASLWGMQYGSLPGVDAFVNPLSDSDTHGIETIAKLTSDAIAQAREKLAELFKPAFAIGDTVRTRYGNASSWTGTVTAVAGDTITVTRSWGTVEHDISALVKV